LVGDGGCQRWPHDIWNVQGLSHMPRLGSLWHGINISCLHFGRTFSTLSEHRPQFMGKWHGEFKRDCDHYCSRKCHRDDDEHQEQCIKPCPEELCERGHKCTKTCHFPMNCGLCSESVEKVLPKCKHEIFMPCHRLWSTFVHMYKH
jgi:hypothetical protein